MCPSLTSINGQILCLKVRLGVKLDFHDVFNFRCNFRYFCVNYYIIRISGALRVIERCYSWERGVSLIKKICYSPGSCKFRHQWSDKLGFIQKGRHCYIFLLLPLWIFLHSFAFFVNFLH